MFLRFTILSVKKWWWLAPVIILPKLLSEEIDFGLEWILFHSVFLPLLVAFGFLVGSVTVFAIHGIRLRVSQSYKQKFEGKDANEKLRILQDIYLEGA